MFGVYVHFPYCRKKCPYCDFAVHARAKIPHERYADAVIAELELRAPLFAGRTLDTVYFGGGTPALWRADCLARVLAAVKQRFGGNCREVTVEANPDELSIEQLYALRECGVDRLSLGVQSFQPRHLHSLGRLHGPDEARAAVKNAREAGFENLSLDLMFALPAETLTELDDDLRELCALEPDHVSIYNLTVEERTPFGAMKRDGLLALPDEGVAAEMYERVIDRVTRAGLEHYEVSSFARPGRRALHNTLYWTGGEYLGLGCSAHSFRITESGGERFSTVRTVDAYLKGPLLAMTEKLDAAQREGESVWLGLRLLDGISREAIAPRFAPEIARLLEEGLLEERGARLRLTRRGVLFADEVGQRFL